MNISWSVHVHSCLFSFFPHETDFPRLFCSYVLNEKNAFENRKNFQLTDLTTKTSCKFSSCRRKSVCHTHNSFNTWRDSDMLPVGHNLAHSFLHPTLEMGVPDRKDRECTESRMASGSLVFTCQPQNQLPSRVWIQRLTQYTTERTALSHGQQLHPYQTSQCFQNAGSTLLMFSWKIGSWE